MQLAEMRDSSSETELKIQRFRKGSSSAREEKNAVNSSGGCQLKKGPWTSGEDAILVEYVTSNGEGNWNAVQKYSGLSRCGKSCRLRWANHLRPDLKKGAFNPEEEKRIIELHAKMGNKWACMAAELPGRTDNEIKNFWNTRIKRLRRAGLPIYPPEICARALNESQQCEDSDGRSAGNSHSDTSEINHSDIPAFDFQKVGLAQGFLKSSSSLLNLPGRSIFCKGKSSSLDFLLPMHSRKRHREAETTYPSSIGFGNICDGLSGFDQYEENPNEKYGQFLWSSSFDLGNPFDPDPNINNSNPSQFDMLSGSHTLTNGNTSSSESISVAKKLELPSLQYSSTKVVCSWAPSAPLPSLESVDIIQSSLSDQTQWNCLLPRNTDLLDAVVYESHLKKSNNGNSLFASISEAPIGDGDLLETNWDGSGDSSISPLSQSSASVFFEPNTPHSGSSSYELQSTETIQESKCKEVMNYSVSADFPLRWDDMRPDALLDSCWFGFPRLPKVQSVLDDVGSFFADDLNFDYTQAASLSAESNQSNALESPSPPIFQ